MNTPFPRKPSVYDLLQQKGQQKFLQLHVDTPLEAAAAIEAGIQILSCEPDHQLEAIRREAPTAFLSAGMPHGTIASPEEAIRAGFAILRRGADAVYCSHSPVFIEAMAREGIPVTGHVGLVPNWATWTNFRAIGKTPQEALRVFQHAKDLENAGAAFGSGSHPQAAGRLHHAERAHDHHGHGLRHRLRHAVPVLERRAGHQHGPHAAPFQAVRRHPSPGGTGATRPGQGLRGIRARLCPRRLP